MNFDKSRFILLFINRFIPGLIIIFSGMMAFEKDLRLSVPLMTGVTAILTIILAMAIYEGEKNVIRWSPLFILVIAALLRLMFLFRPPELSDDIYRYVWDGVQIMNCQNPYELAPADIDPPSVSMEQIKEKINHPDMVTIYPPGAQLVFFLGALAGKNAIGMKIVLVTMDMALCALMISILHSLKLPSWRVALYAWHPLPVIEIAGSGHIDGAGILFFFIALSLAFRAKHSLKLFFITGMIFMTSLMVKLFPLVFLPGLFLLKNYRDRKIFLAGCAVAAALLLFPFLPDIKNALPVLGEYFRHWEFAGFIFQTLRELSGSGDMTRIILGSVFFLVVIVAYTKMVLKNKLQKVSHHEKKPYKETIQVFYITSFAYLMLTPTLHPWYAIYMISFFPFAAGPAGLTLGWSVLLGYRVLMPFAISGKWEENAHVSMMIWVAPMLVIVLSALISYLKNKCDLKECLNH